MIESLTRQLNGIPVHLPYRSSTYCTRLLLLQASVRGLDRFYRQLGQKEKEKKEKNLTELQAVFVTPEEVQVVSQFRHLLSLAVNQTKPNRAEEALCTERETRYRIIQRSSFLVGPIDILSRCQIFRSFHSISLRKSTVSVKLPGDPPWVTAKWQRAEIVGIICEFAGISSSCVTV